MLNRKPDFFVVGAAKSGTTALWKYFQQHPNIFVTEDIAYKELGYYTNQYGIKNKYDYLKFFSNAKENQMIGEVCHAYLTSVESANWIKKEAPNAKIIIMLRNPMERGYSLYNWMTMHGYEYLSSYKKALKREVEILNGSFNKKKLPHEFIQNYLYLSSGLYFNQVERYINEFGESNVKIVEYADFKFNQNKILLEIFDFLKVGSFDVILNDKVNVSSTLLSVKVQFFLRRILLSKYAKNKCINKIFNKMLKFNRINRSPAKLDITTWHRISIYYKNDVKLLSNLCSINFCKKWF